MSGAHRFHETVLREYDIRGIVGQTLTADDAYAIGRSFGTVLARDGGSRVAVGYDGRLSSPEFEAAVVSGLMESGLDVARVGRGPSPMLYFAAATLPADGGIMITGSHNPPDYNGFKFTRGKGSFFGDDIQALGRLAAAGAYETGRGEAREQAVFDDYVARLARDFSGQRDLKVAWDAGNGAAGEAMVALTQRLPGRHILLNETIDGNFPAHHPDPTDAENLKQLIEVVVSEGCDLGIAFDGDGDRIGAVDGQGRIVWGDQLMLLLAREILEQQPGATIIADVKASQVFFDEIRRMGGEPLMWKTGHSLIKSKMAELGAPFAGEMSAHLFFADRYYGFDDALYAAVRLLSVIGSTPESLAAFRDSLPLVFNTPEVRFACPEERKIEVVEAVRARLEAESADINTIDGVRVTTEDGWWLLRASNTQPVLVARCEASDQTGLDRLKSSLFAHLRESGLTPPEI